MADTIVFEDILIFLPEGALASLKDLASGESVRAHVELDEDRESYWAIIANALENAIKGQQQVRAGAIGPQETGLRLGDAWGLYESFRKEMESEGEGRLEGIDEITSNFFTKLDHILRGDPGHQEPDEMNARRAQLFKDFLDQNGWA